MTIKQRIDSSNYTPTLTDGLPSGGVSILHAADRSVQGAHGQVTRPLGLVLCRLPRLASRCHCERQAHFFPSHFVLALPLDSTVVLSGSGFGRCARPFSALSFFCSGSLLCRCRGSFYVMGPRASERAPGPLPGALKAVASPSFEGDGRGSLR